MTTYAVCWRYLRSHPPWQSCHVHAGCCVIFCCICCGLSHIPNRAVTGWCTILGLPTLLCAGVTTAAAAAGGAVPCTLLLGWMLPRWQLAAHPAGQGTSHPRHIPNTRTGAIYQVETSDLRDDSQYVAAPLYYYVTFVLFGHRAASPRVSFSSTIPGTGI